ncbi:methyltransferase type 11 [Sporothrix brasiliensis 5110]|uniref:Methyltransferase type 11 n=1 Tax=Sporothrix brasiliensis 5110 TaxID=1398154 RepID=A0A0C2FNZ4_9PEZI|nr:methyltransferase type 11 [Sporothrix brasiliensis 5110]KIH92753.1 methyltransferase type 11 [Sporothrix brasiliensis 5110]
MATPLVQAASSGFHDAGAYDAHRPSYTNEAVTAFIGRLNILGSTAGDGKPLKIVEIGAGTGKFTEILSRQAVASTTALDIVAVEPHEQMRAQLSAKSLPRVTVVNGHGASLGSVADGTADAVIVAQAFHWFANYDALKEIHRVLKPGATVGVIWNIEDYNKPAAWPAKAAWEQSLNDIICSLASDGSPRFRDGKWQQAFDDAARSQGKDKPALYSPLADDRVYWTVKLAPEALWKRLLTLSQIANLPETGTNDAHEAADSTAQPTSRATVRRRLDAVLARDDVARDASGDVTIHALTFFAWAQKI